MILKKEFYFVRHGQTNANISPLYRDDVALNATGIAQAHSIEPLIASLPIKTICFSPLERARVTKDICCARLTLATQYEIEDLTECGLETWRKMTALKEEAINYLNEPVFSFMEKVKQGVNEALSKEGPVLIVAHGGIHWALCCMMGVSHDWIIENCRPVHFTPSGDGWVAKILTNRTLAPIY